MTFNEYKERVSELKVEKRLYRYAFLKVFLLALTPILLGIFVAVLVNGLESAIDNILESLTPLLIITAVWEFFFLSMIDRSRIYHEEKSLAYEKLVSGDNKKIERDMKLQELLR